MYQLVDNSDAIYQFTIVLIFITALMFFVFMYQYSISLRKSTIEKEQAKQSLTIRSLELQRSRLENDMLAKEQEAREERNKRLEQEIVLRNNELVSSTMMLNQQKIILEDIQGLLGDIESMDAQSGRALKKLKKLIRSNAALENHWDNFRIHFEKVHPNFFALLQQRFPKLTQNDVRHCAFIRMQLSTKEIAQLLNINPTSVQISRVRLKKKLELSSSVDLREFILDLN